MPIKKDSKKLLIIGIIISMFLWGLSWPSGKILSSYCSAFNFAVYRYIVVIISFIPVLFFFKQSIRIKKQGWPSILASAILLTLYSYLFYMGINKGQAGAGGVLVTTLNPIMAYALGSVISKKWPGRNEVIGLLCGLLAGIILLEAWEHPDKIMESGNLYFLFAAFSWALMSKFTSKAGLYGSSFGFSFWQYLITLCCFLPGLNTQEMANAMHITDKWFWLNLIFSSAIVTSLATSLYFYATTKLGAEKASSFIFMVPLSAALSSWLFLGEIIQLHTIVGGIIGIAAVYFINIRKSKVKTPV